MNYADFQGKLDFQRLVDATSRVDARQPICFSAGAAGKVARLGVLK
jgi:hypothetical protein